MWTNSLTFFIDPVVDFCDMRSMHPKGASQKFTTGLTFIFNFVTIVLPK